MNTFGCLLLFHSLETHTFVFLCSFHSLGTNTYLRFSLLVPKIRNQNLLFLFVLQFRNEYIIFLSSAAPGRVSSTCTGAPGFGQILFALLLSCEVQDNPVSFFFFDFSFFWNKETSLCFDLFKFFNMQGLLAFDPSNVWNKQCITVSGRISLINNWLLYSQKRTYYHPQELNLDYATAPDMTPALSPLPLYSQMSHRNKLFPPSQLVQGLTPPYSTSSKYGLLTSIERMEDCAKNQINTEIKDIFQDNPVCFFALIFLPSGIRRLRFTLIFLRSLISRVRFAFDLSNVGISSVSL